MGLRVAVAGASGYAGGELLRLLSTHPQFDVETVTAHAQAGRPLGEVHPGLRSLAGSELVPTSAAALADVDVAFLALPHGAAASLAPDIPDSVKIVDLGSDHRLTDPVAHERYYGGSFAQPWLYGLPELPGRRAELAVASRVANTGCHAVAAILAIRPLVDAGVAAPDDVVVTSASGTSGAGRAAAAHLLASEVMGDLSAYKVGAHRHVPEIKQASGAASLTMTPVLVPMPRGILSSVALTATPGASLESARSALEAAYDAEPFVHVLPAGQQPHTAATAGSNAAHLQVELDLDSGRLVVTCAIDNLGKGAAGQAVQNANLMCGLPETAGLSTDGVAP